MISNSNCFLRPDYVQRTGRCIRPLHRGAYYRYLYKSRTPTMCT